MGARGRPRARAGERPERGVAERGARDNYIAVEISKSKITVVTKWEIVYSVPPHN